VKVFIFEDARWLRWVNFGTGENLWMSGKEKWVFQLPLSVLITFEFRMKMYGDQLTIKLVTRDGSKHRY